MVDDDRGRGRAGFASRRRAGACRSRSRRSRRRTPGRGSRPARAALRRTSIAADWTQPTSRVRSPPLSVTSSRCRKSAPAIEVAEPGQAPRAGLRAGRRGRAAARRPRRPAGRFAAPRPAPATAPGRSSESSFSSRQSSPRASASSSVSSAALPSRRSPRISRRRSPSPSGEAFQRLDRLGRAVVGGVVDDQDLGSRARPGRGRGSRPGRRAGARARWCSRRSRRDPSEESFLMRVQVVDPPAFTPPYDRALCAALAAAGAEVELVTSRFEYGPVAEPQGYRVSELFYRRSTARGLEARGRRGLRLAEHVPGMRRLRAHAAGADVVHLQWLSVPGPRPLPAARRPRAFTVHYPLPASATARRRQRALLSRMDALIAHSEHGAAELRALVGDPTRVHRIPARRLRSPDPPARRAPAARRARRGRGPGDPLLRPDPPVQGRRRPARGVPRVSRARSCGSSACRGWT